MWDHRCNFLCLIYCIVYRVPVSFRSEMFTQEGTSFYLLSDILTVHRMFGDWILWRCGSHWMDHFLTTKYITCSLLLVTCALFQLHAVLMVEEGADFKWGCTGYPFPVGRISGHFCYLVLVLDPAKMLTDNGYCNQIFYYIAAS